MISGSVLQKDLFLSQLALSSKDSHEFAHNACTLFGQTTKEHPVCPCSINENSSIARKNYFFAVNIFIHLN